MISTSLTTSAVLGVVPLLTLIDIVYLKDIGRIFIEFLEGYSGVGVGVEG